MKSVGMGKSHHSFWKGKPYLRDLWNLVVVNKATTQEKNPQTTEQRKKPKQTQQEKSKQAFELTENLVF